MSAVGLAEIADRTLLEEAGWSVLLVGEEDIEKTAQRLEQELRFLLEEGESGSVHVVAEGDPTPSFVEELACSSPGTIVLLPLRPSAVVPVVRALDYARGRLDNGPMGVLITSAAGVEALATEAPSFWSWIGPRVWTVDPTAGQLDEEVRLASLRRGTGLSDADVVERAEAGTLPPDPIFGEWLVLLGRGDLLGS